MKSINNYELRITNKRMRGQVAIIVLLISAVVMTIGLSVSKRTVIETKIDTDEESLKQAFNTAESGVENYLKTGQTTYYTSDSGSSSAVTTDSSVGLVWNSIDFGGLVLGNQTQFYWLVGHNSTGLIDYSTFYTGTELSVCLSANFSGAVKIDYFYRSGGGNYLVWRKGYNVGVNTVNGFEGPINPVRGSCADGMKEVEISNIPLSGNTPLLVTIRPIGGSTSMVLLGTSNFPSQGEEITSTGVSGNNVSQVVKVFDQYRVPDFMIDGVTANSVLSN